MAAIFWDRCNVVITQFNQLLQTSQPGCPALRDCKRTLDRKDGSAADGLVSITAPNNSVGLHLAASWSAVIGGQWRGLTPHWAAIGEGGSRQSSGLSSESYSTPRGHWICCH